MPDQAKPFREWNRKQWAPDEEKQEQRPEADSPDRKRWEKTEWVGQRADRSRIPDETPQEMEEGESGLSGFRHNPGEQHWANTEGKPEGPKEVRPKK